MVYYFHQKFSVLKSAIVTLEKSCEICSKSTIRLSGVFIVNFEHISQLFSSVSMTDFE